MRTKHGLRILFEFEKEKLSGKKMTISDLKRRLKLNKGLRETAQVVRDLRDAGLVGIDYGGTTPKYFYQADATKVTLYDLVMAIEKKICLGAEYVNGWACVLSREFVKVDAVEMNLEHEVGMILQKVKLCDLYPAVTAPVLNSKMWM